MNIRAFFSSDRGLKERFRLKLKLAKTSHGKVIFLFADRSDKHVRN